MEKPKYTPEQMQELRANKNVVRCSEKAITFAKEFKVAAVKKYNEEAKTARQIFKEAGFDLLAIGAEIPKKRLRDWRHIYAVCGDVGLRTERRGRGNLGRPKKNGTTEAERIKWLEAEVAYLKAERDFLAKLRAGREE